jgi:hypothetical protein
VTRELIPAGVGGECLFQKLYVTLSATTVGTLRVTPILDGNYLEEERRYIQIGDFDPDSGQLPTQSKTPRRYEIDLTRGYGSEEFRYGYRGTYWQVEICATDYTGQGRIEIDGVAMRYTVVRETHAWARPFVGELEVDVEMETAARFFFGTSTDDADASIWRAQQGSTDFGERLRVLLQSNYYAPHGASEEALFRTLYLNITRTNRAELKLNVIPVLDGTSLETTEITLPAAGDVPVTEVHEVPLSVPVLIDTTEVGRSGARGVWFSFRVQSSTPMPEGELIFNGAAIDAIRVRETEPGVI